MNGQVRIEKMYAFIVVDHDNTEGIPAFPLPNGTIMPMVGADRARLDDLRPIAEEFARQRGLSVEVVVFTTRMHVDTITP